VVDEDLTLEQFAQSEPIPKLVALPRQPTDLEIEVHNLTHPYADWCDACTQRSGGVLHKRVDQSQMSDTDFAIETDYTFWSAKGFKTCGKEDGVTKSITLVDRKTGMPMSCVVEQKGNLPYVVSARAQFLGRLRRLEYILRGDGEFSLQALLKAIAAGANEKGIRTTVQAPIEAGSHQSIGGAEKMHDTIASFVRTLGEFERNKTGVEINPKHKLFAWLLMHATYIVGHWHQRREGITAYRALAGRD
jgi:hypothetical protein